MLTTVEKPATSRTPEPLRIPAAKRTATAVGAAATAETLATAGAPGTSTVRTTTDHYNSWDPRKANGSNTIGHTGVSSNSRGCRIIMGRLQQQDVSNKRDTSNSSFASNFANLEA
jgi:hypothetical protein